MWYRSRNLAAGFTCIPRSIRDCVRFDRKKKGEGRKKEKGRKEKEKEIGKKRKGDYKILL